MKKVFRSSWETAHVWAQRSQSEGRSSNLSFVGDTLYSYNWYELAKFHETKDGETVVLIRDYSYSSSTGRHKNMAEGATRHYKHIYIHGSAGRYGGGGYLVDHGANVCHLIIDICENLEKIKNSRLENRIRWSYREYLNKIETLNWYCNEFDQLIPVELETLKITNEEVEEIIQKRNKRALELSSPENIAKREAETEKRKKREYEKIRFELETIESDWIKGETNRTTYNKGNKRFDFQMIRLRLNGETVETSNHAFVPVREAKILFDLIKAGRDIKGFKIGYYTVIGINGTLKIGCHNLEREEINRFAESMNW